MLLITLTIYNYLFPNRISNNEGEGMSLEAIKMAVPYIQEILNALGICIMVKEGYEASILIICIKLCRGF